MLCGVTSSRCCVVCRSEASQRVVSRRHWTYLTGFLSLTTLLEPGSSAARIPTESLNPLSRRLRRADAEQGRRATRPGDVQAEVATIQQLTQRAERSFAEGQFTEALNLYSTVVESFPELAITEYARLHRALLLYEVGDVRECLLELDDLEVSLRGFPEVHAALAAVLYAERPRQRSRAEDQWDIATTFDTRYSDPKWVATNKQWPPRLRNALERFLYLR